MASTVASKARHAATDRPAPDLDSLESCCLGFRSSPGGCDGGRIIDWVTGSVVSTSVVQWRTGTASSCHGIGRCRRCCRRLCLGRRCGHWHRRRRRRRRRCRRGRRLRGQWQKVVQALKATAASGSPQAETASTVSARPRLA